VERRTTPGTRPPAARAAAARAESRARDAVGALARETPFAALPDAAAAPAPPTRVAAVDGRAVVCAGGVEGVGGGIFAGVAAAARAGPRATA
jgi:hypothetical protein